MATLKSFTIAAALLVAGTSLAVAQNGQPNPAVIPHDAQQSTAPSPNLRSAVPGPSASSGTHIAHRAPHARLYMQVQHTIPGCAVGQPAAAICACGAANGRPLLCQAGQWCHYPEMGCTQ
jgi:hypothetical protein